MVELAFIIFHSPAAVCLRCHPLQIILNGVLPLLMAGNLAMVSREFLMFICGFAHGFWENTPSMS